LNVSCGFTAMSTGQISAGTLFEVKCLLAIDAIAAAYRTEPPRFESGSMRERVERPG
jgi:hypothetical protein